MDRTVYAGLQTYEYTRIFMPTVALPSRLTILH